MVGIDIGGTFTDVVALTADGEVEVLKVPSTPPRYEDAILGAVGRLDEAGLAPERMGALAHGTTVATNAVLERRGARVLLVTTEGFRDVLELGQMRRPVLVDPQWHKPAPLVPRRDRIEVTERVDAEGRVVVPLDVEAFGAHLDRFAAADSVAVCLLHAYLNPAHERAVREAIRARYPDLPVSLSSDVLPELGEYGRLSTTIVNAYVQPVIERYVGTLEAGLRERGAASGVDIMQSNGALCGSAAAAARPVTIIESGPAAGVAAAAALAERSGLAKVLTFDMGGTTAKASLIENGKPVETSTYEVGGGMNAGRLLSAGGGYQIGVPSIDIAEVGAGGGSQFWIDGAGHPQVGPESSGAVPGPVCYGQGGTRATVTDANLRLGYLAPQGLAGGERAVSAEAAAEAIRVQSAEPLGLTVDEAAYGIHQVANSAMVRALRAVSTERGRDPRECALIAFGGSGPLHAVALAREIEVRTVVVLERAGLFSAVGLLQAPVRHDLMAPWLRAVDGDAIDAELTVLADRALTELKAERADVSGISCERLVDVRYSGQATYLTVPVGEGAFTSAGPSAGPAAVRELFEVEYEKTYGHRMPEDAIEIVNLRVRAHLPLPASGRAGLFSPARRATPGGPGRRDAYFGAEHGRMSTPVLRRDQITGPVTGPLLIDDMDTTTVVPPGCSVEVDEWGSLVITVGEDTEVDLHAVADATDPVTSEIVRNALTSIADEMAVTIVRTARSQIVRDTMDFSTALLDSRGRLISLGLTLLLQLGSLPDVMDTIQSRFAGDINPGDVFVGNDPSEGGMHTPDVYLISPIFSPDEQRLLGWAAAIAQHADVGGLAAGSTSPAARSIFQEGLQIPFVKLYERGRLNDALARVMRRNSRVPEILWSDVQAQKAACERGTRGLQALSERYGETFLAEVMERELDATERLVRSAIEALPDGRHEFTDHLDDDGYGSGPIPITVTVTVEGDRLLVDFEGSSPQVASALNSTMSFTRAAVYAALVWTLARRENLNNAGLFRAVEVRAPESSIVNGSYPAPRGARGTTGFRIIDAVLGALHGLVPGRVPAAGEGGLSVVSFGGRTSDGRPVAFNDIFSSGWGARDGGDGIDGTSPIGANLASTPVETIERYHPVRVERYGFVPDSGGAGRFRGALALERSFTFLGEDGDLQVRSDRRLFRPYGLAGGEPGSASRTWLAAPGGEPEDLPSKVTRPIETGTRVAQVTAGSGGYGDPRERDPRLVLADVLDGKVTVEGAARAYGVQVDPVAGTAHRTGDPA
ncbi:hydantoinase B/oxoprolinase family protein [Pseudonocardia ailaonensis]|uniref:hydantoinase B/oxoprolinase family protein n=1 Tax=Pseudonocardia ailaonensis TaxID=367279 RepID=UPI0031D5DB00